MKKIFSIYLKFTFLICFYFSIFSEIALSKNIKRKIITMLEGRHWTLKAEKFLKLREEVDIVLIEIAGDDTMINYIRFRAMEALVFFPTEETAKFLESTAQNSFATMARRGFISFKRGFQKIQPKRVKKLSLKLLKHSNPHIRILAARSIKSDDLSKFKEFLRTEKNIWVRNEAQK